MHRLQRDGGQADEQSPLDALGGRQHDAADMWPAGTRPGRAPSPPGAVCRCGRGPPPDLGHVRGHLDDLADHLVAEGHRIGGRAARPAARRRRAGPVEHLVGERRGAAVEAELGAVADAAEPGIAAAPPRRPATGGCSASRRRRGPSRTRVRGIAASSHIRLGCIVPRGGRMGMRLACQEQLLTGKGSGREVARSPATAGFDGIELRARGDGCSSPRDCRSSGPPHAPAWYAPPSAGHRPLHRRLRRRPAPRRHRAAALQLSVIARAGRRRGPRRPASWGMFSLRLPPFTPPRKPTEDREVLLEALVELARARRPGRRLAGRRADQPLRGLHGQPAGQAAGLADEVRRRPASTRSGCARTCST